MGASDSEVWSVFVALVSSVIVVPVVFIEVVVSLEFEFEFVVISVVSAACARVGSSIVGTVAAVGC